MEAHGFDSLLYTTTKELEMPGRRLMVMNDTVGLLM